MGRQLIILSYGLNRSTLILNEFVRCAVLGSPFRLYERMGIYDLHLDLSKLLDLQRDAKKVRLMNRCAGHVQFRKNLQDHSQYASKSSKSLRCCKARLAVRCGSLVQH